MTLESTQLKTLWQAMQKVSEGTPTVPKSERNDATGSFYATLDQVQGAIEPMLRKQKLIIVPNFKLADGIMETTLTVVHTPTGEMYSAQLPMPMGNLSPYETAAAITYARRILLCSLFNLRTPEHNEGVLADKTNQSGSGNSPNDSRKAPAHGADEPTPSPTLPASGVVDEQKAEKRASIEATRNLTAVWIEASKALGLAKASSVLMEKFGTNALRNIPSDKILDATAELNLAIRRSQSPAPAVGTSEVIETKPVNTNIPTVSPSSSSANAAA